MSLSHHTVVNIWWNGLACTMFRSRDKGKKTKSDATFWNWLRQSWKKVLEHLWVYKDKILPPLPRKILRNTNVFSSCPRCPNIVPGGQRGSGSLLYVSFVFTNTTLLIYLPVTIFTWVLAIMCQVFQELFSKIVCAEC
jgi:hypothetical protein